MAKARTKAGSSGRGQGRSGVTAAPLLPLTFVRGRKVRDGEFIVVFKRGEDEPEGSKISEAAVRSRIDAGQGNIEELQWLLDQCKGLGEEWSDAGE